jgi:hypothetical protein
MDDLEALRTRWELELLDAHGVEWMWRHQALLDAQWSFLVECHFVD